MRVELIHDANMSIVSFGLKAVLPTSIPQTQITIDATNLRDPHGNKNLKTKPGTDPAVKHYVSQDPRVKALVLDTIRTVKDVRTVSPEGWVSVGVFDHHGQLTSVALVELIADAMDIHLPGIPYRVNHLSAAIK